MDAIERGASELFGLEPEAVDGLALRDKSPDEMVDELYDLAKARYEEKERILPDPAILRRVERDVMLQIVDAQWKDHLYSLDHLKEGIGLRGYGQRDPLVEYKRESFDLFQAMKARIDEEMVRYLWRLRPVIEAQPGSGAPPPPVARPAAEKAVADDPERRVVLDGAVAILSERRTPARPHRRRRRARDDRPARRAEGRP